MIYLMDDIKYAKMNIQAFKLCNIEEKTLTCTTLYYISTLQYYV
jgi:hypothetical protein